MVDTTVDTAGIAVGTRGGITAAIFGGKHNIFGGGGGFLGFFFFFFPLPPFFNYGFYLSPSRCAIGRRRPMPKALVVTRRQGGACLRLYSLRSILRTMSRTSFSSNFNSATISADDLDSSTYFFRIASSMS